MDNFLFLWKEVFLSYLDSCCSHLCIWWWARRKRMTIQSVWHFLIWHYFFPQFWRQTVQRTEIWEHLEKHLCLKKILLIKSYFFLHHRRIIRSSSFGETMQSREIWNSQVPQPTCQSGNTTRFESILKYHSRCWKQILVNVKISFLIIAASCGDLVFETNSGWERFEMQKVKVRSSTLADCP